MNQNKQNNSGGKRHGNFSKFIRKPKPSASSKPKEDKKKEDKRVTHTHKRPTQDSVRINKYIANAGICSRREADELIARGEIKVNGKVETELGRKITREDKVYYKGKILRPEKMVYLLLNKPKGYITTTEDPYERKIVMNLVSKACTERIFPVGRLDRNTTGLLLFTNDGDMAKKLTHPSHNIKKIYHVVLDKPLAKNDMLQIQDGIELEDGMIRVDKIAYAEDGIDKKQVGIEIHSGKNRIVRRIFEHLEYEVVRLDRVSFAGLTKKDIPRGKYRFLKDFEINRLKMLG